MDQTILTKVCGICKQELPLTNFYKNKTKWGSRCRNCCNNYAKEYNRKNEEIVKGYRKEYNQRESTKVRGRLKRKEYRNRPEVKARIKDWEKDNMQFILCRRIRARTKFVLRKLLSDKKIGSFSSLIGCTGRELVSYIESLWLPGMNWDNRSEWHIDHIIPLASFNLLDSEELSKASHYTNLRPLWAKDNKDKSDFLPDGSRGRLLRLTKVS